MTNPNDSLLKGDAGNAAESGNEINKEELIPSATTSEVPSFGWGSYAERINGRFAMIGFAAVLLIEAMSNESFLHWSGLVN